MRIISSLLTIILSALSLSCAVDGPEIAAETDRQFILSASELSQFCMAAGQAAATTTTSPAVREYAQRVVAENNAINRELIELAWRKRIQLKELSDSRSDRVDSLQARKGPMFDQTFTTLIADTYGEVVALYETEMEWGRDVGVQSWARTKLPALRERLKRAEAAKGTL